MNKNKHLISKYLEGELDALSSARFEEDLRNNPVLREEMAFYKEVDEALADSEVMELRMQLNHLHTEITPATFVPSRRRFKRLAALAAAASLALIFGISAMNHFWYWSNQELVEKYYKPYENLTTTRSAYSDADRNLQNAMLLYENQKYREALILFEKVLEKDNNEMGVMFYSGISYFEIAEYISAVRSFTKVIEQDDNLYIAQSKWYLGLCYLRTEEKEKAIKQFKEIAKSNSFYSDNAKKILKKLQ